MHQYIRNHYSCVIHKADMKCYLALYYCWCFCRRNSISICLKQCPARNISREFGVHRREDALFWLFFLSVSNSVRCNRIDEKDTSATYKCIYFFRPIFIYFYNDNFIRTVCCGAAGGFDADGAVNSTRPKRTTWVFGCTTKLLFILVWVFSRKPPI